MTVSVFSSIGVTVGEIQQKFPFAVEVIITVLTSALGFHVKRSPITVHKLREAK